AHLVRVPARPDDGSAARLCDPVCAVRVFRKGQRGTAGQGGRGSRYRMNYERRQSRNEYRLIRGSCGAVGGRNIAVPSPYGCGRKRPARGRRTLRCRAWGTLALYSKSWTPWMPTRPPWPAPATCICWIGASLVALDLQDHVVPNLAER